MFKKEPNRPEYTAHDIDRYLGGKMSPAERNALEKAALEDPFLEEALEGYGTLPRGRGTGDAATLREGLHRRVERETGKRRQMGGLWWKAAAIVVLIGSAVTWYVHKNHPATKELAQQIKITPPVGPVKVPPATDSIHAETKAPEPAGVQEAIVERAKPRSRKARTRTIPANADTVFNLRSDDKEGLVAAPGKKESYALPAPMFDSSFARQDSISVAINQQLSGHLAGVKAVPFFHDSFLVSGQVVDARDRQPVAFATVHLVGTRVGAATDQDGYFRFRVPDTNAKLAVSAVGYQSQQYYVYEANRQPSLQLIAAANSMDEVVVTALGKNKPHKLLQENKAYHAIADSTSLEPVDGWDSYNDYLSSNLQIPDDVLQKNVHGNVDLTFQVDESGKPVHISVVRSLCGACDAEAVRLLQQGPQWKKKDKHKNKAGGTLKVHF